MKRFTIKLLIPLMPMIVGVAYAASDSSIFDIQVKHVEFLNIVGSAAGFIGSGHEKTFAVDDVRGGNILNIGTLGLESTFTGACTLGFSSSNTKKFSLKYETGGQTLTDYQLIYTPNTTTHTINSDTNITLACNTLPAALDFQAVGKMKNKPKAGLYSDTVTFTVTSP
jgi:spore coat protein U-like protein